jgi:hypothetical protein
MNNLYKELSRQAVEVCTKEKRYQDYAYSSKFAELIVQECLSQISDHLDKERIKKHFGLQGE